MIVRTTTLLMCERQLQAGTAVLLHRGDGRCATQASEPSVCPVHDAADCMELFVSAPVIAGWSLLGFWRWRQIARRAWTRSRRRMGR